MSSDANSVVDVMEGVVGGFLQVVFVSWSNREKLSVESEEVLEIWGKKKVKNYNSTDSSFFRVSGN